MELIENVKNAKNYDEQNSYMNKILSTKNHYTMSNEFIKNLLKSDFKEREKISSEYFKNFD